LLLYKYALTGIFQFCPTGAVEMKLKIGDEEITDSGKLFSEATFISETEAGK